METTAPDVATHSSRLEIRLLGPVAVLRDGAPVSLPPSRKVRALLAYLTLARGPVARERLCSLLWDVPDDPRGELRWCLSKLRAVLDTNGRSRVVAQEQQVRLDLDGCIVDVERLAAAARAGPGGLDLTTVQTLAASCGCTFLEGTELRRGAEFAQWLAGRRSELRSHYIDVVADLARRTSAGSPEGLAAARRWLDLAPVDVEEHARFLAELYRRRMLDAGRRHMEAAAQIFASEDVDFAPVRASWARIRHAPVASVGAEAPGETPPLVPNTRHAAIAVMPFRRLQAGASGRSALGDALEHDIISRLARLRSLFVIARGSVFALAEEELGPEEIGRRLDVDYVATGLLEEAGDSVTATVEVCEVATARIVWTERFEAHSCERLAVIEEIGDGIVSSIAAEIENAERNRAVLKHPDSLDAWEAYHRGLWHMYRFTSSENARAASFFRQSIELDPTFSRAYAGLSFTHWQSAFQRWSDRETDVRHALDAAGQSLLVDDHHPAAHWAMGRARWLVNDQDEAVRELERSVQLSPNFALGHYSLAFVHAQSGDPAAAILASDQSRILSPYDPLLFGMLGTRAIALVRLGALDEAAEWSIRAAARPNAHVHMLALAALCLALAGRIEQARKYTVQIALKNPGYSVGNFLETFSFAADVRARYRKAASLIGLTR